MSVLAIVAAFGAAAGFAVSTSLEHLAAGRVPATAGGSVRLVGRLARQPLWLAGQTTGGVGFLLHALALSTGALAVVQPIMVSGMVLAIPVRAALDRRPPLRRDLGWAAAVAAGLALVLAGADPLHAGSAPDGPLGVALVLAGAVVAAVVGWLALRAARPGARGLALGAAAGVLYGLIAGVLKLAVGDLGEGVVTALSDWPVWTLLALGAGGLLLNQRAYQAAPLSASMPALNIVDPLVAIAFGYLVFAERPATTPLLLAADLVGFVLMAVGMRRLARHEPVQETA